MKPRERVETGQTDMFRSRLMAGLAIIKHADNLSDEDLVERWVRDPYYQYLCGEEFFQHKAPFDRSSLTRWRQRMYGGSPCCSPRARKI